MTTISVNDLPPLQFTKIRNITYARTYKNRWINRDGKRYSDKYDVKVVGRIDNTQGVGEVIFTNDFYMQYPSFRSVVVVRKVNEVPDPRKKFVLEIVKTDAELEVEEVVNIEHKQIGIKLIIEKCLEKDPLVKSLQKTFPHTYQDLLSLATYFATEQNPIAMAYSNYAKSSLLFSDNILYPSDITRLFESINTNDIMNFFKRYLKELTVSKHISKKRLWAIDSTSISTYANLKEAKYGHNKQGEELPQLNIMLLTDEESQRPLFYHTFNGSIPDVAACETTFDLLLNLGAHSLVFVGDRGFFSENNFKSIISKGYHFAICVPYEKVSSYKKYRDEAMQAFVLDNYFDLRCNQQVYTCKSNEIIKVNGKEHKAYVHVFFNQERGGLEASLYCRRLKQVEEDYIYKKEMTSETVRFFKNNYLFDDEGNPIIDKKTKRPKRDNAVFQKRMADFGLYMVLSDSIKKASTACLAYKNRAAVEYNFSTLKTRMNMKRFRVGSEISLEGKCFVMFLAITLRTILERRLLKSIENQKITDNLSLRSVLNEISGITQYYFSDTKKIVVKTLSKKQKEYLELFNAKIPTSGFGELAFANRVTTAIKPHGADLKK